MSRGVGGGVWGRGVLKSQSVCFEDLTNPSVSVENVVVDNNRCILRSVKILEDGKKWASYFRGGQKVKSALQRYSEQGNILHHCCQSFFNMAANIIDFHRIFNINHIYDIYLFNIVQKYKKNPEMFGKNPKTSRIFGQKTEKQKNNNR